MTGPYREEIEPPLARYPLRTSWQAYMPTVLGVLLLAGFGWLVYLVGRHALSAVGLMLAAIGVALVAMGLYGVRALRVAGGRGELRIFRDRIELPRPYGSQSLVIPKDHLRLMVTQQVVRFMLFGVIPAGEMNRGFLLTVAYPGGSRVLSDRLFQSQDIAQAAVDDLERLRAGLEPLGPSARPPAPIEATRDELDARIDDELERL